MVKRSRRFVAAIGVAATALLALTGCVEVDATIDLNGDGRTGNLSYMMSYSKEQLAETFPVVTDEEFEAIEGEPDFGALREEDLCKEALSRMGVEEQLSKMAANFTLEETETHCIAETSTPISYRSGAVTTKINGSEQLLDGISLTQNDGKVAFTMDIANMELYESNEISIDSFRVVVNFPAEVVETNGTIDGNSVSWEIDGLSEDGELWATGNLPPFGGIPVLAIAGGVLLAVAIGAGGFLLYRRKSTR